VECGEAERPFKLMSGGRFIFTNLRDTDAFPKRRSPIPDVRLPYEIVQGPKVSLAKAAALNANFPPVFPKCKRLDSLPGVRGFELPEDDLSGRRSAAGERTDNVSGLSRQFGSYFSQMDKTPSGGSNPVTPASQSSLHRYTCEGA
jgi:hypothetical protein